MSRAIHSFISLIILTVDAVDLAGPERFLLQLHFLDELDEFFEFILAKVEVDVYEAGLVLLRTEILEELCEGEGELEGEFAFL